MLIFRDKRDKDKDKDSEFDLNRVKVKEEPLDGGNFFYLISILYCIL